MLTALRIRDLALVEELSLDLSEGFTVLTGETGAGKSLLVDALALMVGARADAEVVRQGCSRTTVEGVVEGAFEAWSTFLEARGLPGEQPVVLRREVAANGRSRAWINGSSCSMADLREAGRIWMRLASQHDHQNLLSEDRHLALLDEVLGIVPDLGELANALREADAALKARRKSESERLERQAWLEEHLEQLGKLAPKPGEWSQLRAERETLRHAALLQGVYAEASRELDRAVPAVEAALRAIQKAAVVLPQAQEEADRLRSAALELEDLGATARDQALHWSRSGADRLEAIEGRLALFERLARRHACEPDDLLSVLNRLMEEQHRLLGGDQDLASLEQALAAAAGRYVAAAESLHERRQRALAPLERDVHARLGRLGMGGARIQVRLAIEEEGGSPATYQGRSVRVGASGFSLAALWIEPNAGEGFRPLAKVASGGELSRVLLALLGAGTQGATETQEALTLVLDEVDAGLGGETALAVGLALRELAATRQLLAVTHLAQVAARADHHGFLAKTTDGGRTRSALFWLDPEARTRELARLLSGHADRPEALQHARMLQRGG